MPVLAGHPRAVRTRAAARGHPHRGVHARHRRDRQPHARAGRRRRRRAAVRLEPGLDAGRRRRRAGGGVRRSPRSPSAARTTTPTTRTSTRRSTTGPRSSMDDGADLLGVLHADRRDNLFEVIVGTEGTTTGVMRLKAMEADGVLAFPIIAVNEAQTKHLFEDRYGTGQSTIDGIIRATNVLLAGRTMVVAGYGLARPRHRRSCARHGRPRDRARGRPDARVAGRHGRPPRDDRRRCRAPRRHLRHRHRRQARAARASTSRSCATAPSSPTPATSTSRSTCRRSRRWRSSARCRAPTSSCSACPTAARSRCWPTAASSTSAPPRASRPPSWT